jgi:hypothetical protein
LFLAYGKSLLERGIVEDCFNLGVALGRTGLFLAARSAEPNFYSSHSYVVGGVYRFALHRTLDLFGLASDCQLMVCLGGVLCRVGGKCFGAIRAAEIDLAAVVIGHSSLYDWLARNWALGAGERILFLLCLHSNDQT